jgi:hypothetical protein
LKKKKLEKIQKLLKPQIWKKILNVKVC